MARPKGSSGGPSQTKMVLAALHELGGDAKPQAIQEFVRTRFGRELSRTIISNYKSNMKKKGAIGAAESADGGDRGLAAGGEIRVEDLETVRGLVGRLGVAKLHRLVDVLA